MRVTLTALVISLFLFAGLPLIAIGGPNLSASDTDGDGVPDAFDNCMLVYNANQADEDHNGCGDVCTVFADANGDGIVGGPDYACVIAFFGGPGAEDPDCDFNDDGVVGGPDFAAVIVEFGARNGLTGIPEGNPLHGPDCFGLPIPP